MMAMNIPELLLRCVRLLKISRKPTDEEFAKVTKVTAIGIVAIGVVGLLVSIMTTFIDKV